MLLTSFLLITVPQFNIFKDMYCHNICNLLMIINHLKKKKIYKYSNKKHEKGCQNNLEENYIELCWISISSVTMTQIYNWIHFVIKGMIRFVSATLMRLAHSVLRTSPRVEGNLLSKTLAGHWTQMGKWSVFCTWHQTGFVLCFGEC